MARTAEGLKLIRDRRTGIFLARFTHAGRGYKLSTHERDPGAASGAASRLYADVVAGRFKARQPAIGPSSQAFDEVAAAWLAEIESSLDEQTFGLYRDVYVGTHFAPFFATIDTLTTVRAEEYIAARLKKVTRGTVKKELSVLRRFAKWARRRGYLTSMPEIETPGRNVTGKAASRSRKRVFQVFTPEEIASIIARLPEQTRSRRHAGDVYPVRARFVVAWETALRPETLNQLRAPDDYRRGEVALLVRDDADKARYGRELPLSMEARAALDSVCPEVGAIFGEHDYRAQLRKAARAAGIPEHRAKAISDYDFRHSRLTHLGEVSNNLSGIMYIAGHKDPGTTAHYMRPQKRAAEKVLAAASAAAQREFRAHSGHKTRSTAETLSRSADQKPSNTNAVRGGGLEPPWLLTASTSS
jgi:site-specific recombinase XerD